MRITDDIFGQRVHLRTKDGKEATGVFEGVFKVGIPQKRMISILISEEPAKRSYFLQSAVKTCEVV